MLPARAGLVSLALAALGASGCSGGGGGGSGGGDDDRVDPELLPDLGPSVLDVTPAFGTPADGESEVAIELLLINEFGRPIRGAVVELEVSGCGNVFAPPPPTDVAGRTRAGLASLSGERKTIRVRTRSGGRLTEFPARTTEFLLVPRDTFFVRATGSDAASGRSPVEAWATLSHALASAGPGATVHVGAGIYPGPLELALDSRGTSPFVLAGDREGVWTGDPGAVVIVGEGSGHALGLLGARHAVLQRLTFRGAGVGLSLRNARGVRVLACEAYENERGLEVEGCEDVVVQDCRLTLNSGSGARIETTRGLAFENDLVYANGGAGLELAGGVSGALVRHGTFFRNGGPHVVELDVGGSGLVEENVLSEGLDDGLALLDSTRFEAGVNLVWGNYLPSPPGEPEPDTIEANPLFADPFGADGVLGGARGADDDFRVLPGSDALDTGRHLAFALVLGSHESLATRTTRSDGVREASGPDLPASNLGYHAPLALPPYESLPRGGGALVHVPPGEARAHPRAWSGAAPDATEARSGPWLDAEVLFLEHRTSPLESREELVAAQVRSGSRGRILVRSWDGRLWSEPALSPHVDGIPLQALGEQRFDVEYDAAGRAFLVWADGDGVPSYSIREGGRWSPARDVAGAAAGAGDVTKLALVPRAGTGELALVTLDDAQDLVVTLWDGFAWSAPRVLEANTLVRPTWRPFDAAFESGSGDLLVSWGFSVFAEETRWATLERASGTWRTGQHPSTDAVGASVVLAADPASDRIAALFGEGDLDNDVSVSVWDGSQWVHTAELTLAGPVPNRLGDVAWLGRSGVACAVFRRSGDGSFNYALFLPTGWRIQPDVVLSGPFGTVDKAVQVVLAPLPDEDGLLGAVLDRTGTLFAVRFDGLRFHLLDGGAPLATGLDAGAPSRPFDAAAALPRAR